MSAPIDPPVNPLERVAPYAVRDAVLPPEELADLIAFAVANEPHFEPASVGSQDGNGLINPEFRTSLTLPGKHFKAWRERIEQRVAPLLPEILRELGVKPFDIAHYEIELVRHNDGDFYRRHIDIGKGQVRKGRRAVSLVYYFHAEPKAFEGGALRLYALARNDIFADIQPGQNRLIGFASWVPHEVMPISCPSQRFIDSRFAINCWVRMKPVATPIAG